MALSKILALLSLVAALLLVAQALPFRHGSSRLRGPGAALADLLLAAVDRLDEISLVDLATRRNMVLLCHAILLVLLGDAGLLGVPARRRRTTTPSAACYYPPEHARTAVVLWRRNRNRNRAANDDIDRQLRRGTWLPTAVAAETGRDDVSTTKEIVLVEEPQGTNDLGDRRLVALAGELDQPAAAAVEEAKAISSIDLDLAVVADQADKKGAEEEECGEEEEEDLDEMNRRFEAFIATTKKKMRLEALHVPPQNRALLAP